MFILVTYLNKEFYENLAADFKSLFLDKTESEANNMKIYCHSAMSYYVLPWASSKRYVKMPNPVTSSLSSDSSILAFS